ncbi:MAG: asparaginase domain-containing protein [Luminiphilus sp.]|nr:asparaginase domain-containing protein [Luminiphilus sp.]
MHIQFITTGGTIDKIYFDALSQFEVGDSQVKAMPTDALVDFSYDVTPIMKKDSLDITNEDREFIRAHIEASHHSRFIITHGTERPAIIAVSSLPTAPIRRPKPLRHCVALNTKQWY